MSYIVTVISSVFKQETMIYPIQLLLISIAFQNVISEICVTSNFEENFDEQFSSEFGICVTNYAQATGDWSWGNYSSTSVEPPHPSSSLFIAPSSVMSCTSSFNFFMTSGGTFELYVYMDASAMTDQLLLFINEVIEGGDDVQVGQQQLLPFLPDYQNGWHTLEVTLEGTGTYEGYITLLASAANQSTLIVDAFRYIPPSSDINDNNNDCNIYALELDSEEITDENESEDNSNESGEIYESEEVSEESIDESGEDVTEEDAEEVIDESGEDESGEDIDESGEDVTEEDTEEGIDESGEDESGEDIDESGEDVTEEDAEEGIDESGEDESGEDIDESGEDESEEGIDESGVDESDGDAGEDSEEDTNSTINPVTLTSPTLPGSSIGTQSTTSETNTEITTTLTTEITHEPILVTEPNNSTEDNNTEQPEIQPITDNSFWNPFTLAMVVILSLIALAILGFCCYEFGKRRAQDKLPLMYNDIEVPVSMIVPRVTKVYPDTRVMSFD